MDVDIRKGWDSADRKQQFYCDVTPARIIKLAWSIHRGIKPKTALDSQKSRWTPSGHGKSCIVVEQLRAHVDSLEK